MGHLQIIACSYKFPAVPERYRWLYGKGKKQVDINNTKAAKIL
jgi:hypothetical protein